MNRVRAKKLVFIELKSNFKHFPFYNRVLNILDAQTGGIAFNFKIIGLHLWIEWEDL